MTLLADFARQRALFDLAGGHFKALFAPAESVTHATGILLTALADLRAVQVHLAPVLKLLDVAAWSIIPPTSLSDFVSCSEPPLIALHPTWQLRRFAAFNREEISYLSSSRGTRDGA